MLSSFRPVKVLKSSTGKNSSGAMFRKILVLIACLGLLGLASYSAERRTKEIGIRKVLGASVPKIVVQFSREFFTLVVLSNLIAWPIAYFAMKSWLGTFAYHINLSFWSFLFSGIIALFIAVATISYQAIRAGYTNPADSLRYE
jgi:putative ABC transport system permease protein